ncbi:hypothetical protein AC249_AIPGENE2749 [Exaiptasia diaphana]|nr:hypothetical protein AC249_AIPGENE2749 [Exaiptasia diaphana]
MEGFNISLTNHLNSSTHTDCKYWGPESDAEIIAKRIAFVLVILLGIFGNVFIILLAAKFTVRRNLNYLIINMAVSDTLFLLASLLMYIPWISNYKMRIQSKVFRRSALFLWHTSVRVSIITLLVISIERFRATKQTIQQPYTLKQRMTVLGFCCILWIVEFFFPSVDIMDDSACIDWRSIDFIIFTLLLVVNSCFSPLIYIVFLPDFKEAAKKVLFRGRKTQNQAPNGGNSIELQPAPNCA